MSRDLQQHRDNSSDLQQGADVDVDAEHDPEVSRRASNAGLRRQVQMKGGTASADSEQVQAAAERGTAGPGTALPHADTIQRAFGSHDISDIRAHVGGNAQAATGAMGAEAYATGNQIAFAAQPDLHTAAHEAAHVVQQKQGVSLSGGVGQEGDSHEKQADAIADQVVAGKSVEHLLGAPSNNTAPVAGQAVQKKPADKPVDKKAAGEDSELKSFWAVEAAMTHYAKELREWGPKLDAQQGADTKGPAGIGPVQNVILDIYNRALNDAQHIGELISVAGPAEKGLLATNIKVVKGAFHYFYGPALRASNLLASETKHGLDVDAISKVIDGYADKIGHGDQNLEMDTTPVTEDEAALSKNMMATEMVALEAALASVKAGNTDDAMRVNIHIDYLFQISGEHKKELSSHKPKLKKYLKELEELITSGDSKLADRLSGARYQLTQLSK